MPLTKHATDWLALLDRETPVPTSLVEKLIVDEGVTPHPVWLDFHETYAGYHEYVGPDLAVWGLSRSHDAKPAAEWVKPNTVTLTSTNPGDPPDEIFCADAHPVHDYRLLDNGWFMGVSGPCERFEIKIERDALMWMFGKRGKMKRAKIGSDLSKPEHQQLMADMQHGFVPEASDSNGEYYLEDKRLLRVARRVNQLQLWKV